MTVVSTRNYGNYPGPSCPQKAVPIKLIPIRSVHSVIGKVMEGVSKSAIKQNLLTNNLLTNTSVCFSQDHSVSDLFTWLIPIKTKELNSRGEISVIALDIKAAFNSEASKSSGHNSHVIRGNSF